MFTNQFPIFWKTIDIKFLEKAEEMSKKFYWSEIIKKYLEIL